LVWETVDGKQKQQQIPFGDDNKKGKYKGKCKDCVGFDGAR
jgi:hypothetical protein